MLQMSSNLILISALIVVAQATAINQNFNWLDNVRSLEKEQQELKNIVQGMTQCCYSDYPGQSPLTSTNLQGSQITCFQAPVPQAENPTTRYWRTLIRQNAELKKAINSFLLCCIDSVKRHRINSNLPVVQPAVNFVRNSSDISIESTTVASDKQENQYFSTTDESENQYNPITETSKNQYYTTTEEIDKEKNQYFSTTGSSTKDENQYSTTDASENQYYTTTERPINAKIVSRRMKEKPTTPAQITVELRDEATTISSRSTTVEEFATETSDKTDRLVETTTNLDGITETSDASDVDTTQYEATTVEILTQQPFDPTTTVSGSKTSEETATIIDAITTRPFKSTTASKTSQDSATNADDTTKRPFEATTATATSEDTATIIDATTSQTSKHSPETATVASDKNEYPATFASDATTTPSLPIEWPALSDDEFEKMKANMTAMERLREIQASYENKSTPEA